jgi:hypothetical protein
MWNTVMLSMLLGACSESPAESSADSQDALDWTWLSELDTRDGVYHLVLEPEPDPPTTGLFRLGIQIGRNSDNPDLDGALVVNAGVRIEGQPRFETGDLVGVSAEAEELGAGRYLATWTFAQAGEWLLDIEVGASEDKDIAVIWMNVEE